MSLIAYFMLLFYIHIVEIVNSYSYAIVMLIVMHGKLMML